MRKTMALLCTLALSLAICVTAYAAPAIVCEGRAWCYGTGGADVMRGKGDNNRIDARAGNDNVDGRGGNDEILGRAGNDTINAGPGDDVVNGNKGADSIMASYGNDVIKGGPGKDELIGSYSETGTTRILGGPGNDTIYGQHASETIVGGRGHDVIVDGPGDDVIRVAGDGQRDRVTCTKNWNNAGERDGYDVVYAGAEDVVYAEPPPAAGAQRDRCEEVHRVP